MLEDLIRERRKKLEKIKQDGIDPYPASVEPSDSISEAHSNFTNLEKSKKSIVLKGRLRGIRDQGNIVFLDLEDGSGPSPRRSGLRPREGGRLQAVLKKDGTEKFGFWKDVLDTGDFILVKGPLFKTQKGEESIDVASLKLVAKSTRPIPSEWYGLEDTEARLRQRYLDLLLNEDTKNIFRKKAVFWQTFRDFLKNEDFLEVETPALELTPGGAEAEPFKTHHNALDTDFYLRISLELPLKKLLVAGFERVFEIGRVFRNEGIDKEHLQDYTQLEFYGAYQDYNDLMKFVEKMYKAVIKATCGKLKVQWGGPRNRLGQKVAEG